MHRLDAYLSIFFLAILNDFILRNEKRMMRNILSYFWKYLIEEEKEKKKNVSHES